MGFSRSKRPLNSQARVAMVLVNQGEELWPKYANTPGALQYDLDAAGKILGFGFICPCGCGYLGGVTYRENGWQATGPTHHPSVTPSIYFAKDCIGEWHGYLTNGIFEPC